MTPNQSRPMPTPILPSASRLPSLRCDENALRVPASRAPRRAPGGASDSSEVLAQAQGQLVGGQAREAVRLLSRSIGESEHALPGHLGDSGVRMLALGYALLGYDEDAQEWLSWLLRRAPGRGRGAMWPLNAVLQVALAHLSGDDVLAIRIANQVLAQQPFEPPSELHTILLATMGAAYLRLAQIAKARQCADAIVGDARPGLGATLAELLRGELDLARVLRQVPKFRSQLLFVDEVAPDDRTFGDLSRSAENHFDAALALAGDYRLLERWARGGQARSRLLRTQSREAWNELEQQVADLGRLGCAYARERASLQLGIWRLLSDNPVGARQVLEGIVTAAMSPQRAGFCFDALYYGALASSASGDSSSGFSRLAEFMSRLRARNLCRAVVPPPNLEGQSTAVTLVAVRPKSAEVDDLIVARVMALVRDDPTQLLSSDDLATLFGVSRRTLQYRFRRATGKTPKEFVTGLRIEHARELILAGGPWPRAGLEKIASASGFPNYRTFSRSFRARFGHAPADCGACGASVAAHEGHEKNARVACGAGA